MFLQTALSSNITDEFSALHQIGSSVCPENKFHIITILHGKVNKMDVKETIFFSSVVSRSVLGPTHPHIQGVTDSSSPFPR